MKKLICLVLIACILLSMMACAGGAHSSFEEEYKLEGGKKAIIILPGLLASGLYDEETQEPLWDPVKSDAVDLLEFMGVYDETHEDITLDSLAGEFADLLNYATDVIADKPESIMRRIMCDEKGNPADPHVKAVPVDYEGHQRYGALNSYKWWAEGLEEVYGDRYEIVVYNYNWLTDTRYAAIDFARFMSENNYTESILIGHSMGGLVANEYLALAAENRARIDKFIAVAVPFYGSYMASSTFENPYVFKEMIDSFTSSDFIQTNAILSKFVAKMQEKIDVLYENMILDFLFNMKSVYQLLPSPELLALQAETDRQGVFENGQRIAAENVYEWYLSRPFATSDPTATKEEVKDLAPRDIIKDWDMFRNCMYVKKPQGKVFACDLVDTYYVAGTGINTELSLEVDGEKRSVYSAREGDGTVPLLSATRGRSAADDHVYLVEGETHIPMGTYWAGGQKDAVLAILS